MLRLYIFYTLFYFKIPHTYIYFPKSVYLLQATSKIMNSFLKKNLKCLFKCLCSVAYFRPQSSVQNPMFWTKLSLDALNPSSLCTSAEQTTCLGLVSGAGILDRRVYPESFQAAFELGLAADENLQRIPDNPAARRSAVPARAAGFGLCRAPRGRQRELGGGGAGSGTRPSFRPSRDPHQPTCGNNRHPFGSSAEIHFHLTFVQLPLYCIK